MSDRVVLLSGGLDSAVVLARTAGHYAVTAVIVDYGQKSRAELECARRLASIFECQRVEITTQLPLTSPLTGREAPEPRTLEEMRRGPSPYIVPGRNAVLIALAASVAESVGASSVLIGANRDDETGFPDCRPKFLEAMDDVLMCGTNGQVSLEAPLATWPKPKIVSEAIRLGYSLPIEQTCSCYFARLDPVRSIPVHCGRCDACQLRRDAFYQIAAHDPTEYLVDL